MFISQDDYIRAAIGGAIIAIATSLHLLLKGRITGISGIYYGLIAKDDFTWKFEFLLGYLLASSVFFTFFYNGAYLDSTTSFLADLSIWGFLIGGFLVGFGTKLGNGCTSGHGICGLPRFSKRSIVATVVFSATAIVTATLKSNFTIQFLETPQMVKVSSQMNDQRLHYIVLGLIVLVTLIYAIRLILKNNALDLLFFAISFGVGLLFASGLIIAGMAKRTKVRDFLVLNSKTWDPSLAIVLLVAVGLNIIFFNLILKKNRPLYGVSFGLPSRKDIDFPLVFGAIIFGLGWGLTDLCPGPAIINLFVHLPHMFFFCLTMTIGQFLAAWMLKKFFGQSAMALVEESGFLGKVLA